MVLIGAQAFVSEGVSLVDRIVVVEHLYFHSVVGSVYAGNILACTDADAVVDSGNVKIKLKAEDEVAVVFLGVEVALTAVLC